MESSHKNFDVVPMGMRKELVLLIIFSAGLLIYSLFVNNQFWFVCLCISLWTLYECSFVAKSLVLTDNYLIINTLFGKKTFELKNIAAYTKINVGERKAPFRNQQPISTVVILGLGMAQRYDHWGNDKSLLLQIESKYYLISPKKIDEFMDDLVSIVGREKLVEWQQVDKGQIQEHKSIYSGFLLVIVVIFIILGFISIF